MAIARGWGGRGVLRISSDRYGRMEAKIETPKKLHRASNKTHENPWAKN